nr:class I SAM-dependent methyltransferase [Trichlorobacter sp.]
MSKQEIINIALQPPEPEELPLLAAVSAIDSLIQAQEVLALYRLCRMLPDNAKILEIGSFNGSSAMVMGHAIKEREIKLFCIDPWHDYLGQEDFVGFNQARIADGSKIMQEFVKNTSFLGTQLKMLRGFSADFATMLAGQEFDLIFIDGAHDYGSVRADIMIGLSALKPGGLLTGHDFHSCGHGVRQAVNSMLGLSPTISNKGVIEQTYIWFAQLDQPGYEHAILEIEDLYAAGDLQAALTLALKSARIYKTEELVGMIATLKQELHR